MNNILNLLYYTSRHNNALLLLGFCDYVSSIFSGRQSTCGRSRTTRGAYVGKVNNLTLKYRKILKIGPPKPWFKLDTFCTKVDRLDALILLL